VCDPPLLNHRQDFRYSCVCGAGGSYAGIFECHQSQPACDHAQTVDTPFLHCVVTVEPPFLHRIHQIQLTHYYTVCDPLTHSNLQIPVCEGAGDGGSHTRNQQFLCLAGVTHEFANFCVGGGSHTCARSHTTRRLRTIPECVIAHTSASQRHAY